MNKSRSIKWAAVVLAVAAVTAATLRVAIPEDIDLFSVDEGNQVDAPNVLIVLDNSANWSRQSQQWPGGLTQGQSEVRAIKTVINGLDSNINVGLLEYSTGGSSSDSDGGYVRYNIRPLTTSNKSVFSAKLDTIFNNINDPTEKRSSGNPFGTLFWDVYNYLSSGLQSKNGTGTPSGLADADAYQVNYSRFRSPLTSSDSCRRTIVIFIANNVQAGPTGDDAANVSALQTAGGTTTQIPFADYTVTSSNLTTPTGYSSACYSSASACSTAENNATCTANGFTSCSCDAADAVSCASSHYSVVGVNSSSTTTTISDNNPGVSTSGQDTGQISYSCKNNAPTYTGCPATTTQSTSSGNQTTSTTTSWASCSLVAVTNASCNGNGSKKDYFPRGTKTVRTVVTQTNTTTTRTPLSGETAACYNDAGSCSTTGFNCAAYSAGCACDAATNSTGCGAGATNHYQVLGNYTQTTASPTGTFSAPPTKGGLNFMSDEWARFLHQVGVPLPGSPAIKALVTTYTLDVFNAQQDASQSALLFNIARVGGGKYFQAKNEDAIVDALKKIFAEVQSVNSAFSSASLPVNATNRAQNENQVYIGVFKPDRTKDPRWFGNLKRYQLISTNGVVDLGDVNGNSAINLQTGFIADCATSFWTSDSGTYWSNVVSADPVALGQCTTNGTSDYSDAPDGPFVEKGGVAEVLRKGNDPAATADAGGNYVLSRTVKTLSGGALADFSTTTAPSLDAQTVNFIRGQDTPDDEDTDANTTEPRASIHGDVIHSRPQPINYGGTTGVVVFYGANDGTYRAVQASTGQELWSFIAPEFFSKLARLKNNTPLVQFFGDSSTGSAPKDYFFDGSTGVYQNADNSKVMIFPTMRRGGRKIYAFDVTDPNAPTYSWSKGCPNATNDTGCDTDFSAIGQTWAVPNVARIKGYNAGATPVLIMGGGYDRCEDADTSAPSCGSAKGRGVYVLNALTGALLKYFDFSAISGSRSVAADVALVDVDADGFVDYAYAADTGGNIYRMDFINGPLNRSALGSADWVASRVAYTNGASRKFLYPPAILNNGAINYLAIGTGDREHPLEANYPYQDGVLNRFYVFKDNLNEVDATTALNLDDTSLLYDYTTNTTCDSTKTLPTSAKAGWFMNLNQYGTGEQAVSSALIAGGSVIFSTNRPTPDSDTECTSSLGEARGYFVDLLNASGGVGTAQTCGGDRSSTFVGGGLPPSPVIATVPIDGKQRTIIIGAVQKSGGASSIVGAQRIKPVIDSRRKPIYWRHDIDAQ